tara:strand:+ start:261 stop:407 length:147 start_codon:yes stop_codon:yes gene_type:complete
MRLFFGIICGHGGVLEPPSDTNEKGPTQGTHSKESKTYVFYGWAQLKA